MKLRTKFAIAILVVMVVLSTIVLGSVELFKQQTIAEEQGSVAETANLTARQIESEIETRREEVRLAGATVDSLGHSGAYLPAFVDRSEFFAAQTVAANGTVLDFRGDLAEAQRKGAIGTTVGDRPHVAAALNGSVAVSEPERIEGTNVTILKIAAPIYESSPQNVTAASSPAGALVGAIYVDFSSFFATTRTVRTTDQTVAVFDTVDGERLTLLPSEKSFARNLSATAAVGLRGWEWTVRVTRDRSALDARLNNLVFVQGASLLVVLATLVGLGVWEYRTNLKQAENLLDGFGALKRGNYDYTLSLSAAEEWEQISHGFTTLAAGLRAREAALREREQRLEVLNRVLRHNVRNEMSVIHNYADIISDFADDSQLESAADTIITTGRDLIALSDKAKQIRRAFDDADRRVTFDAEPLAADLIDDMREAYPAVEFHNEVPEGTTLVGIPALADAVENVVENACEHNDADDPVVTLAAEVDGTASLEAEQREALALPETEADEAGGDEASDEDDDEADVIAPVPIESPDTDGVVRLSVTDNGPGIPEHEYAVLTQGEETALEHGSGLGLWLVYWVVDKSGGNLAFEDNEPTGATVTMELPAADSTAEEE